MEPQAQSVTLHPGSDIELTMFITTDSKGRLLIRADLSSHTAGESESRIERGKYRAFSNAVHSAVYAAPKHGVRMKSSYAIATNDSTGEVTCTIPASSAVEAAVLLHYLSAAPSRLAAMTEGC